MLGWTFFPSWFFPSGSQYITVLKYKWLWNFPSQWFLVFTRHRADWKFAKISDICTAIAISTHLSAKEVVLFICNILGCPSLFLKKRSGASSLCQTQGTAMISFGHCKRTAMCEDCQTFSRMHSFFLLSRQLDCVSHSSLKSDGHVLEYRRSSVMCQPKAQCTIPLQILDPLPRRQAKNFEVLYTAETHHDRAVQ